MTFPKDAQNTAKSPRGRPRSWDDKTAQNTIKALDRAMEIFEHLSQDQGKTLSALASDTGQSTATVYRVLSTLEGRGLVEFDVHDQVWFIGAKAFLIGTTFLRRTSLVERARPVLRALMEQTGETANLGIESKASVLFVSQVETHAAIRAFFPPGTLSPLHASGIGKVLLSQMDDARLDATLHGRALDRFTPHTLTDPDMLRADLARTRARGYAIDGEERNLGMTCIAAPVFDIHGEVVSGLSVSGPVIRMSEPQIPTLALAVQQAAAALTSAIGGTVPAGPPPS